MHPVYTKNAICRALVAVREPYRQTEKSQPSYSTFFPRRGVHGWTVPSRFVEMPDLARWQRIYSRYILYYHESNRLQRLYLSASANEHDEQPYIHRRTAPGRAEIIAHPSSAP